LFQLTSISIILFITTLINLFTTAASWNRRKNRAGGYFAFGMLSATFWTLAAALDYAAVPLADKIFFAKLETIGYNSALALFAMFGLSYAGRDDWLEKTWVRGLFIALPLSDILLAWTNDLHHWLWRGFLPVAGPGNTVIFEHGPALVWTALSGYSLILILIASLWQAARRSSTLARRQATLLLVAVLVPMVSNLVYLVLNEAAKGIDWTSITFSLSGLLCLLALYGARLLDLTPIARNVLIEQMSDGVLVLDGGNRLVDANLSAQHLLGIEKKNYGASIEEVFARQPEMTALLATADGKAGFEINLGGRDVFFDIQMTPLEDARGWPCGRVIVVRDISERKRMEAALRLSEDKFHKAFHSSPDAIAITRLEDGRIVEVNEGFCRLSGYSRQESMEDSTLALGLWANPHDREQVVAQLQQGGLVQGQEYSFRSKSGELLTGVYSGEIIRLGTEAYILSTIHDITRRKQAEEELLAAQQQLLEQHRELAKVQERQRVRRDLHDSVSQSINSLVLFTETLVASLERGNIERTRQIVERVQESARQANKEIRLLLYGLQDTGVEEFFSLTEALEDRLTKVERRTGVRAKLIQDDLQDVPPMEWTENLFWIAIEALNNALKYSQAHHVEIILRSPGTGFEMEISDDGNGFDPGKVRPGGLGMRSMRERTELLGGKLEVISSPGNGTRVCFRA
jgi:PAS domain S-box-containing protein